ncbi:hypothetical protein QR98_0065130 [Sarcoptes scabiei]|uniref:Uncharacterized protein n=1 Tax=Sarcoptes scabiei TaxID=52283 RepID=A0A132AC32_SARSC|nr:hypothetical protein QR98_0065130 [Sarcoptes scabiei]
MSALSQVIDHLDEDTVRRMVLPKTKQLFGTNADAKKNFENVKANRKRLRNLRRDKLKNLNLIDI